MGWGLEMSGTSSPNTVCLVQAQRQWWLLLILVGSFAFGFRLYYVTQSVVVQNVYLPGASGNAAQYYNYARNLVQHGVFSAQPSRLLPPPGDSFRDPGYPVFLAAWMKIFQQWDSWYAAVLFSQAILSAATVVFWLCLGRRWMPTGWLAVAGAFMAIWPHSVAMSSNLLSETLYSFLVALAMYVFGASLDKPSFRWAIVSGFCFSLAAYTNGVLTPFAALLVAYMLTRKRIPAKIALTLIATTLCLTAPWMIRNHMQQTDQPSSTDRALMNLVEGSWPIYHSADMASILAHNPQATRVMGQINQEITVIESDHRAGLATMLQRMAQNPSYYVLWYLKKPALLWAWDIRIGVGDIYFHETYHSPFNTNALWRAIEALCHACNWLLLVLALITCLLVLLKKNQKQDMASVALLMIFVTAVHSILQAEPRYSIPYRGAEIMLGIFAAHWITTYISKLRTRSKDNRTRNAATTQSLAQRYNLRQKSLKNSTPLDINQGMRQR